MKSQKLHEYSAFFESNGQGGYTVVVPALPRLVKKGKSLEHARRMAKDAIKCYLAGLKKAVAAATAVPGGLRPQS
ncbi:MAG TPA: type II toxin-antitoxin system HicB family antitoxin [Terriglobia bacterium]|nr:type II toxin-antitoxin system HicB family antitoxin [Terriglobia bacterium]